MSIRIGVIGYGYWGPNLARNFAACPGAKLAAVSDTRPDRLQRAAQAHPVAALSANWRDLINDTAIDAVAVATPVSTHSEIALAALNAGKHVFVEKPMTATVDEGVRLVEMAHRKNRILMVDHTFVYTGAVRKIREIVQSGHLGDLYYYDSVRVNLGLFQSDVNVLWDLAVHDLAILDYIVDARPTAVSATGMSHFPGSPENIAYLTLFFDEKLIAHIHANWLAPVKIRGTLVSGSKKMVVYNDLEPSEKIRVYDSGVTVKTDTDRYRLLVDYRAGDMWAPRLDHTEALAAEAAHFVDCINLNKKPLTDGECGLRIIRALEAAGASMAARGAPIELGK